MESSQADTGSEPIRFRSGKKRKAYRQRTDTDAAESSNTTVLELPHTIASPLTVDDDVDEDSSVTAALKLRNARRARLGGVAFGNNSRPESDTSGERAVVLRDPDTTDQDAVQYGVSNRFMQQTGKIADLDGRHMCAPPAHPPPGPHS